MVGICIILDGTAYRESIDLTAEEFYARMGETISHQTASPSVGDWLEVMREAVDAGAEGLLVVTLAAVLSSTYNSARAAAELAAVPAVVVDSHSGAAAQGLLVRRLAEEARDGATLEQLVERAGRRRRSYHLEFVLESLRRLAHSGPVPTVRRSTPVSRRERIWVKGIAPSGYAVSTASASITTLLPALRLRADRAPAVDRRPPHPRARGASRKCGARRAHARR
jgi:fatty acid-binding protein DegV